MIWPEVLVKFAWFVFGPLDEAVIGMKVWLGAAHSGAGVLTTRWGGAGAGTSHSRSLSTESRGSQHRAQMSSGYQWPVQCQPEKWSAYKLLHACVKWDGVDLIHQEVSVTIFSGWSYLK